MLDISVLRAAVRTNEFRISLLETPRMERLVGVVRLETGEPPTESLQCTAEVAGLEQMKTSAIKMKGRNNKMNYEACLQRPYVVSYIKY
jgi:hypothetical protein